MRRLAPFHFFLQFRDLFLELFDLGLQLPHFGVPRRQFLLRARAITLFLRHRLGQFGDLTITLCERGDVSSDSLVSLRDSLLRGGQQQILLPGELLRLDEDLLALGDLGLFGSQCTFWRALPLSPRPALVLDETDQARERAGLLEDV